MCGIVGYTGRENAVPVLLNGLKNLEYRGYDSSGVAITDGSHIFLEKRAGRIRHLEEALKETPAEGKCGIGHTRWATHGGASDKNAHPFASRYSKFAVVHNGIITNYLALAEFLREKGVTLFSDTDSEVIAHLIDFYYTGDVLSAIKRAARDLKGSFALGIISVFEKDVLYGVRKDSPLLCGIGKSGNMLCSDFTGISAYCDEFYTMSNGEIAVLTPQSISIYDFRLQKIEFQTEKSEAADFSTTTEGAESFMLSEIREVPSALSSTLEKYPEERLRNFFKEDFGRICLVGCGSAYHAALLFKSTARELLGIRTEDYIASEFLTERWEGDGNPLVIAVSQSGETADTLQAVRKAKKAGAKVLCVCNVRASSLVRLADEAILTRCGAERAVAATKSYAAQALVMFLLCLTYAEAKKKLSENQIDFYKKELSSLPLKAGEIVKLEDKIAEICLSIKDAEAVFFLGRNADYYAAKEGSLKLKEISYVFSEAYPSGELKHGTLALMENGVYTLSIATDPSLTAKDAASIAEVKARGARTIAITTPSEEKELKADESLLVPDCAPIFSPLPAAIVMQYVSYFIAKYRGCDTDKPRNLAKSVTVE